MTGPESPARLRVAVVDDEEDVLTFLRLVFEDRGFEVLTTDRPGAAVALLRRFQPDLVCLDLLMPEHTGASLYVAMRRVPELRDVPVLILTGLETEDALVALKHRADGIPPPDGTVEKPLDVAALLRAVEAVLPAAAGARS